MKVEVPSGAVYEVRQLNAMALANIMKGFPSLAPEAESNGTPKAMTMASILEGAEYQRAVVIRGCVSPVITEQSYEDIEGPDVDVLMSAISRMSFITGAEVKDAGRFRNGSHDGGDGGRVGAAVRDDAVGASSGEPAVSGA